MGAILSRIAVIGLFLYAAQDFSQQHGYAAVLERGTESAPVVWYAASNVDITEQLIKAYDTKNGIGASSLPNKSRSKPVSTGQSLKQP